MSKTTEYGLMEDPMLGTVTADTQFSNRALACITHLRHLSSLSWCHKQTVLPVKLHRQDQSSKQFCMNNELEKKKKKKAGNSL